jgi:hypothetical protein
MKWVIQPEWRWSTTGGGAGEACCLRLVDTGNRISVGIF